MIATERCVVKSVREFGFHFIHTDHWTALDIRVVSSLHWKDFLCISKTPFYFRELDTDSQRWRFFARPWILYHALLSFLLPSPVQLLRPTNSSSQRKGLFRDHCDCFVRTFGCGECPTEEDGEMTTTFSKSEDKNSVDIPFLQLSQPTKSPAICLFESKRCPRTK